MLEVQYKINHTNLIAVDIAKSLNQEFKEPMFHIASNAMNANFEFYKLNEHLSIQISHFVQYQPIRVTRLGTENNNLLVMDFHITGIAELNVTDNRLVNYPKGLVHGAYFASGNVESNAVFPSGFQGQQFHIVLDKEWMGNFFSDAIVTIMQQIDKAGPFLIYERLNSEMTRLLLSIFQSTPNVEFRKSFLYGKTLELLSLFFGKLLNRTSHLKLGVSDYSDVTRLFDLMTYVDQHLEEHLTVEFLSEKIGFSESKLQKLCKAVYGKSLFKEITERRMIKALELFAENQDSVSAVGYRLGYSNMSHFSKAFKKVHGFLPSEYKTR